MKKKHIVFSNSREREKEFKENKSKSNVKRIKVFSDNKTMRDYKVGPDPSTDINENSEKLDNEGNNDNSRSNGKSIVILLVVLIVILVIVIVSLAILIAMDKCDCSSSETSTKGKLMFTKFLKLYIFTQL